MQQLTAAKHSGKAPGWAVGYGQEFWRSPPNDSEIHAQPNAKPITPCSVNLGDVIERVSHALDSTADGGAGVQTKNYAASFAGSGFTLSAHRPADTAKGELLAPGLIDAFSMKNGVLRSDQNIQVAFQTVSIRRGEQFLFASAESTPEWFVLGNTAQRLLSPIHGLVEHFETRAEGVAITWVMAKRPPGAGPLVVETELAGLSYLGETAGGHHFADAEGTARVRVGRVTAVDAAHRSWPLTTAVNGQHLRLELDASILAQAQYPLAIDPLIGPEFGIDNPMIAPGIGEYSAAVAANGNNYLVVWEDTRHAQLPQYWSDIYGARVTTNGLLLDVTGIGICTAPGNQRVPKVAARGNEYLVVWSDERNGSGIYGTRVTSAGLVLDGGGLPICTATGVQDAPAVAASSNGFLVVWTDSRSGAGPHVYGTRVSSTGVVSDGDGIPIGPQTGIQGAPAVASSGADFLAVWHDASSVFYRTINGARVTADGVVSDPNGISISGRNGVQAYPSVGSDGHDYLVAWQDDRNRASGPTYFDIYGARVTSSGMVSDPDGIPICTALAEQYVPAVAAGAGGYLVVWLDHRNGRSGSFDMYGARVTSSGVVEDTDGIPIHLATRNNSAAAAPAVAAAGSGFLVVWSDESILAKRVDSGGAVLDTNVISIGRSAQREELPAVASNGSEYLVVWLDWRGFRIIGARVTATGVVADPDGLVISATPGVWPKVASDGNDFLVVWTRSGIVGARVSSAGMVLDPDGLAISRLPGQVSAPALASDGRNYLVAWAYSFVPDDDALPATPFHIHGARLSGGGEMLDDSELEFTTGESNQSFPTVASNGREYLVAWEDGGVYGARVSGAGVSIGRAPISICAGQGRKTDLAAASNGRDYLVVWTDSRDLETTGLDVYGTRVTSAGIVLDQSGLPIAANLSDQSQPAVASNGSDYLVVWTDARNVALTGRDIYGARVNAAGIVADPDGLAINQQPFDQQLPAVSYGGNGRFLAVSQGFPDSNVRTVANLVSGIPPTPHLHIRRKPSGGVILSWAAEAEGTYLLQFKERADASAWTKLCNEFAASGPIASAEDNASAPARLYRVLQVR